MSRISEITESKISSFIKENESKLKGFGTLEETAQKLTDIMYQEFKDSIVLVRVFATAPFERLPVFNQEFVRNLAAAKGITSLINAKTLVLSLLGTYGEDIIWNDRHNSNGHVGIPLASADFIGLIPMMSRLMKALGVPLDWISSTDRTIIAKAIGNIAGVFYVPDAKVSTDEQGRKIIPTQDFVDRYKVKTVFGIGGGYILGATFITIIVFTREEIEQQKAELFMPLISLLKSTTTNMVTQGRIFA